MCFIHFKYCCKHVSLSLSVRLFTSGWFLCLCAYLGQCVYQELKSMLWGQKESKLNHFFLRNHCSTYLIQLPLISSNFWSSIRPTIFPGHSPLIPKKKLNTRIEKRLSQVKSQIYKYRVLHMYLDIFKTKKPSRYVWRTL